MSPNDLRHGTYAGAVAHWFDDERPCDRCSIAEARYRKTRHLRHLRGEPVTVSAIGVERRIHALMALGWTGPQIAADSGVSLYTLRSITYHGSSTVRAATADKVAACYGRLSMTRPEGHYANRARSMARKRGWPPPLAFDEDRIDDPDHEPTGWEYQPSTRAEVFADLVDQGGGVTEVATRLGLTRVALEKWCGRNGYSAVFSQLVARETAVFEYRNQHAGRGAA